MAAGAVSPHEAQVLHTLEHSEHLIRTIQRALARGRGAIGRTINGQDGEGAVEIVLTPAGVVRSVHLDEDWREILRAGGLSGAVLEAYQGAHASRLSDWADAVTERGPGSFEPDVPATLEGADGIVNASGPDAAPAQPIGLVSGLLAQAGAELDAFAAAHREPAHPVSSVAVDLERPDVATDGDVERAVLRALGGRAGVAPDADTTGQHSDPSALAQQDFPALHAVRALGHDSGRLLRAATSEPTGTQPTSNDWRREQDLIGGYFERAATAVTQAPFWLDIGAVTAAGAGLVEELRAATSELLATLPDLVGLAGRHARDRQQIVISAVVTTLVLDLDGALGRVGNLVTLPESLTGAAEALSTHLATLRASVHPLATV